MTAEVAAKGMKIMVVDDSKTIRNVAEKLLSKEGYIVLTAEDGYAALPKIVDSDDCNTQEYTTISNQRIEMTRA